MLLFDIWTLTLGGILIWRLRGICMAKDLGQCCGWDLSLVGLSLLSVT